MSAIFYFTFCVQRSVPSEVIPKSNTSTHLKSEVNNSVHTVRLTWKETKGYKVCSLKTRCIMRGPDKYLDNKRDTTREVELMG